MKKKREKPVEIEMAVIVQPDGTRWEYRLVK